MKNITKLFILVAASLAGSNLFAQCPYDNSLVASGDAPQTLNASVYATDVWGGEMIRITSALAGNTYSVSTCSNAYYFDSQLTIYPANGGNPIAYNDDGCGIYAGPSYLEFTPSQDGDYDLLLDEWDCMDNTIGMDIYVTLIAIGGGGGTGDCGTPATPASVTIPVVVHVLYNTADENISDAQILSQIKSLNCDYRHVNGDFETVVPPVFQNLAADLSIEFCLASVDPNGNPTTGITRTQTNVTEFLFDNNGAKHSSLGGYDNWDPTKYLNIWTCNLGNGLLGYATFPADLPSDPSDDGVVILYTAFGTEGTINSPYNLGRTATHEVGHWLNLLHVWGDAICGDDLVDDTPTQEKANYGCQLFPHITCNNGPNGDLFVDFMDYSDDGCLAMFTNGQKQRTDATLAVARSGLATSQGCGANVGIYDVAAAGNIIAYPNPGHGIFTIKSNGTAWHHPVIEIYNIIGKRIQFNSDSNPYSDIHVDLKNAAAGLYFISITDNNRVWKGSVEVQ